MCRFEHDLHNQGVVSTSLHVDPLVVTSHAQVWRPTKRQAKGAAGRHAATGKRRGVGAGAGIDRAWGKTHAC